MENKFERKNGTGNLFLNENKKTDKHPDMTGTLLSLDGIEYYISAWTREGKKGKYLSISIREKNSVGKIQGNDTPTTDFPF